jgi:hypothetical protein
MAKANEPAIKKFRRLKNFRELRPNFPGMDSEDQQPPERKTK